MNKPTSILYVHDVQEVAEKIINETTEKRIASGLSERDVLVMYASFSILIDNLRNKVIERDRLNNDYPR